MDTNNMQKDFLKELANVGIGHAATSLAQMISMQVDISLPKLNIIPIDMLVGLKTQDFSIVSTGIQGDLKGLLVITFSNSTSYWLIDKMFQNPEGTTKEYNEEGKEALKEFINIIGGSFLTALSDMLHFNMMPKIPKFLSGKGIEMKDELKTIIKQEADEILSVRTDLKVGDKEIEGNMYLILEKDSFTELFNKMNSM
jgi:chemotaxis protein CheC